MKNLVLAAFLFVPSVSNADGISNFLIEPYITPCWQLTFDQLKLRKTLSREEFETTIEGDETGLYDLYLLTEEANGCIVKKEPQFVFDDEMKFFMFTAPDPLPISPSPVPIENSFMMLFSGLALLFGFMKWKKKDVQ